MQILTRLLIGKYDGAGAIARAYEDFKAGKLENNTTGIMSKFFLVLFATSNVPSSGNYSPSKTVCA
jgi:hypothetical protein